MALLNREERGLEAREEEQVKQEASKATCKTKDK
jgi:hypothetical protein